MAQHLKDLKLHEVSLVDSPANKGARVLLFKRDGGAKKMAKGFAGWFAKLMGSAGGAAEIKKLGLDENATAAELEAVFADASMRSEIEKANSALATSISSIVGDDTVTDKAGAVVKSLGEFKDHMLDLVGPLVQKAESDDSTVTTKGDTMPSGIKKALGLAETATDAEVETAIAKMSADNVARIAKLESDLKFAGLSDIEKAYTADVKMTDVQKAAFCNQSEADRAEEMKKKPAMKSADETYTMSNGRVIAKRALGEAAFDVAKETDIEVRKARAETAEANDRVAKSDVVKRISVLKFVGAADEIGALIHSVTKLDAKIGKAVEEKFTQLNAVIEKGDVLKEHGRGHAAVTGSASEEISKKAAEIRKGDPKLTIEKARMMARDQLPEIAKREVEERKEASRAA